MEGRRRGAEERGRKPFAFEILLVSGQDEAAANIFTDALRQLGIKARVKSVDAAQYNQRKNDYDFDMIVNTWNMSLSPGNEQTLYWGSKGVTEPGTRNYMGVASPAAEAMIAEMLATRDPAEFRAAVQALDRVLTTGRYVIPFGFSDKSDIAYKAELRFPEQAAGLRRLDRLAAGGLVAGAEVAGFVQRSSAGETAFRPGKRRGGEAAGMPAEGAEASRSP